MVNKIKTKKAFTLAELTVALSIVGVLAAIVVPAVHNMAPNKEMIMFKKAYGEFVRITSEMVNNDDLYPESFDGTKEGFANTDLVNFRGAKNAKGKTKFCKLFAEHASIKETKSACNFITNDGVQWILPYFSKTDDSDDYKDITIDVNGALLPNSTSNTNLNRDRFQFSMNIYGKIKIDDTLTKKYLTETDLSKSLKEVLETP